MNTDEEKEPISDQYDLYKQALKVHSPILEITPDFILSDLNPDTLKSPAVKFVREQIKLARIMASWIKSDKYAKLTADLLLCDCYSTIIMTRATGGQLLKGIIDFSKTKEEEPKDESMLDKARGLI